MSATEAREALRAAWNDGHRAGIGCGHDLSVCRHDDAAITAELDDLASWNEPVRAALAALPDDGRKGHNDKAAERASESPASDADAMTSAALPDDGREGLDETKLAIALSEAEGWPLTAAKLVATRVAREYALIPADKP